MVTEQKLGTLTLRDLITRFLSRSNLSPKTVDYYSNTLSHLQWYASQNDWSEQVENITRGYIRDLLDYVTTERHRWPGRGAPHRKRHHRLLSTTMARW